jgi:hypothetical protein
LFKWTRKKKKEAEDEKVNYYTIPGTFEHRELHKKKIIKNENKKSKSTSQSSEDNWEPYHVIKRKKK